MADPRGFAPFHNPYESSYTDDISNIFNTPNPTFADLTLIEEPFMHPPSSSVPPLMHSSSSSVPPLVHPSSSSVPQPNVNTFMHTSSSSVPQPNVEAFMHPSSSSVPQSNFNTSMHPSSSSVPQPNVDAFMHPSSSSVPQSDDDIGDADDPFDDPIIWEALSKFAEEDSPEGLSHNCAETSNQERAENGNYDGNMRPLPIWPVPPVPYLCSCCLVLREIIHSNGHDITKLEIHGRLGMICHAILEIRQSTSANQYQMFDFCKKSIEDVKSFLVQYCDERKQAGLFMLPDPLSIFYEALCVGLDLDDSLNTDDFIQPPVPNSAGTNEMDHQVEVENEPDRIPRNSLAVQRERTGKLTLRDLAQFFHLPIEEAAKRMKLCPTVLKKICRRDGLVRWPHRKIKSIEKRISSYTARLSSNDAEERAHAQAEIEKLRDQMTTICAVIPR